MPAPTNPTSAAPAAAPAAPAAATAAPATAATPTVAPATAAPKWNVDYDYQDRKNVNRRGSMRIAAADQAAVRAEFAKHPDVERINNLIITKA